ncbi:hypothetical protein [Desulfospira joergensenii]|uniref:hypothetical protein n=1 Tax=Desulfospira joergensenii TaxID=53329 RepID=UPI0003B4FE03|nr:hypothetical protein [Desulfospira joergensenii]
MIPAAKKGRVLTLAFMLFAISVPLFVSLYFSDPSTNSLFQGVRQRKAGTDFTKKSKEVNGQIFLLKDSLFTIKNLRLTFKGIKKQVIYMEVYLLELDPQTAYPYTLSTAEARAGVRLGDYKLRLISANKNLLKIKVEDLYGT